MRRRQRRCCRRPAVSVVSFSSPRFARLVAVIAAAGAVGVAAVFGPPRAAAMSARSGTPSAQYLLARDNNPPKIGLTLPLAAQNPDAHRGRSWR
jgi:hypothetical protein